MNLISSSCNEVKTHNPYKLSTQSQWLLNLFRLEQGTYRQVVQEFLVLPLVLQMSWQCKGSGSMNLTIDTSKQIKPFMLFLLENGHYFKKNAGMDKNVLILILYHFRKEKVAIWGYVLFLIPLKAYHIFYCFENWVLRTLFFFLSFFYYRGVGDSENKVCDQYLWEHSRREHVFHFYSEITFM